MNGRRWTVAEIDLEAVAHNVRSLCRTSIPADVWAVVKADGYGHGAVRVARAALDAGATGLCVALVQEGAELRGAGIDAPILVLSEQPPSQLDDLVRLGLAATVYSGAMVDAVADAARRAGVQQSVHLKIDSGMQRVGARPDEAVALARRIASHAALDLAGVSTHLACADTPDASANAEQLGRFHDALGALDRAGLRPRVVHAANSAAAIALPSARFDAVRCGIAVYGISPGAGVDHLCHDLQPALRLVSRVSHVKRVDAGSHVSYGWRHRFERDTVVATVPAGYADGVPRRLGTLPDRPGADVLVHGRRCPIVGVVTMDQLVVDVGALDDVAVGDDVVLLGRDGGEAVTAVEWADRLGTIGYEIVCGISRRVERVEVPGRTDR